VNFRRIIELVSTNYLKSIGHPAAKAPIKAKSIVKGGGKPVSISKKEVASNGKLGLAGKSGSKAKTNTPGRKK
jgi:hypothetical protein